MNKISLNSDLKKAKILSDKHYQIFSNINIKTIKDLLHYYPNRYDNFTQKRNISGINQEEQFHFNATVQSINTRKSFRRNFSITDVTVRDETGFFKLTFFNNKYLSKYLKKDQEYYFLAQSVITNYGLTITNPIFINKSDFKSAKLIIPVYSQTKAFKSKWLAKKIDKIIHFVDELVEFLPENIIKKFDLIEYSKSIKYIHKPQSNQEIKKSRDRIAFNEIFLMQIKALYSSNSQSDIKTKPIKTDLKHIKQDISKLPFKLTNYQKKSIWDIVQDIDKNNPMNRLLEGDVGSGKTVVAAIVISLAAHNHFQSVLIAPTEILAGQHFKSIKEHLAHRKYSIALLTSSMTYLNNTKVSKKEIISSLEKGNIDILIATHAVWQKNIVFKSLNFVIIDEQHRFGVQQRNLLSAKDLNPHTLTMSATPIPRSLALSIFGHIKISQIKALPKGRKPIKTRIIHPDYRMQTYKFIDQEITRGHQVFVVCPLIEESEKMQLKSVTSEYKKLQQIFPNRNIGLLHGQLKDNQKDTIMQDFASGKIDIMVSTSVIEVGIDVPNANIILIEGSERFGLSQLHQFRGRVGRGLHQSYCFLFTDLPNKKVITRLRVLQNTNDGFKIAEEDLKLRGPGELSGFKQSGLPDLKMASLSDHDLISKSLKEVKKLLKKDPDLLLLPNLKSMIKKTEKTLN